MFIVIVVGSLHLLKGLACAVDSRPKPIGCRPLKTMHWKSTKHRRGGIPSTEYIAVLRDLHHFQPGRIKKIIFRSRLEFALLI
jgi:hypothetical protein